jgi:hypothetical protein
MSWLLRGVSAAALLVLFVVGCDDPKETARKEAEPAKQQKRDEREARRAAVEERQQTQKEQEAKRFADELARREAEFSRFVEDSSQWRKLPDFVMEVVPDASGEFWYAGRPIDYQDAEATLRDTVARAAARQTRIIHGGQIRLIDSRGRWWVSPSSKPYELWCYDGKTWLEDARRHPMGEGAVPSNPRSMKWQSVMEEPGGRILALGFEYKSVGERLHIYETDGKWSEYIIQAPPVKQELFRRNLRVVGQAGGRIAIAPTDEKDAHVILFDGADWSVVNPAVCTSKYDSSRAILPLKDGSIGTLCSGNQFWVYWPDGLLQNQDVDARIADLAATEPEVRESATRLLIGMGPSILETLRSKAGAAAIPEVKVRLNLILATLESVSTDHEGRGLHGGRYTFRTVNFLSRATDGRMRLLAQECVDHRTGEKHKAAILTSRDDGAWDILPVPTEQWAQVGVRTIPGNEFEDSREGVWLRGGYRIDLRRGAIAEAVSDVGAQGYARAEDRHGVLFLDNRTLYNPHGMAGVSDMAMESIEKRTLFFIDGQVWAVDAAKRPAEIHRIDAPGKVLTLPEDFSDAMVTAVLPLGDAMLAQAYSERIAVGHRTFLYDGQKWHGPAPTETLARQFTPLLVRGAGNEFKAVGPDGLAVASDGRGGVWLAEHYAAMTPVYRWGYFDGTRWIDVQTQIDGNVRPRYAVLGGRAIIAFSGAECYLVEIDATGNVKSTRLGDRTLTPTMDFEVVDGDSFQISDMAVAWRYAGGHMESLRPNPLGRKILTDSAGRVWRRKGADELETTIDGRRMVVPESKNCLAMAEGPDRRLWMLTNDGVSEVIVQGRQAQTGKLLKWDQPKTRIERCFVDRDGWLWICGEKERHQRYKLP